MAITQSQLAVARQIMGIAAAAGLNPARQRELVAAAYAESGLNPRAVNKSSGAAGLFQLLSSGYRTKAQQLGGLFDIGANTKAILPSYLSYWQKNPNAAAGAAGRDVERSGMGAEFYSRPLSLFGGVEAGSAPTLPSGPSTAPGPTAGGQNIGALVRSGILNARRAGRDADILSIFRNARLRAAQQPLTTPTPAPTPAASSNLNEEPAGSSSGKGLAEAFYDPLGSWDNGRFGGPIGHHMDHVHLSITNPQTMLGAISQAQKMGLQVGENPYTDPVDPVHVKGSFHYQTFGGTFGGKKLGEAIDVSGSPEQMAAYYRWATGNLR